MYKYWIKILDLHNIPYVKQYLTDLFYNQELIYRQTENHKSNYIGGGKVLYTHNNKKIIFYKTMDEYSIIYSIKEYNLDYKLDCLIIIIEKEQNLAVISGISNYNTCLNYDKTKLNGHNLLDIAINFIKYIALRYDIKSITLTDNSNKPCIKGNKIKLSKLYIMISGHTWYGSKGFIPFDKRNDKNNYNKLLLDKYEENLKIFNNTKVSDVYDKFSTYLTYYDEDIIIKIMKKNMNKKFGYFLKYILKDYDNNCYTFSLYYEELFDYIGYNDFYSISFRMNI